MCVLAHHYWVKTKDEVNQPQKQRNTAEIQRHGLENGIQIHASVTIAAKWARHRGRKRERIGERCETVKYIRIEIDWNGLVRLCWCLCVCFVYGVPGRINFNVFSIEPITLLSLLRTFDSSVSVFDTTTTAHKQRFDRRIKCEQRREKCRRYSVAYEPRTWVQALDHCAKDRSLCLHTLIEIVFFFSSAVRFVLILDADHMRCVFHMVLRERALYVLYVFIWFSHYFYYDRPLYTECVWECICALACLNCVCWVANIVLWYCDGDVHNSIRSKILLLLLYSFVRSYMRSIIRLLVSSSSSLVSFITSPIPMCAWIHLSFLLYWMELPISAFQQNSEETFGDQSERS